MTPDQLSGLAQLTWITVSPGSGQEAAPAYWKKTTIPGLKAIFELDGEYQNLAEVAADIPAPIRPFALKAAGFSNFYPAYRPSCRKWLRQHRAVIAEICSEAAALKTDDAREGIAVRIDGCSKIPRGGSRRGSLPPSSLLAPLVASLDPRSRFPIANSAVHVKTLLRRLGVVAHDTPTRVQALMGIVNHAGVGDAFYLDTAANYDELPSDLRPRRGRRGSAAPTGAGKNAFPKLGWEDPGITAFLRVAKRVEIQHIHKQMTNALHLLLKGKRDLRRGRRGRSDFDVLVVDYLGDKRDLLIEVKSLTDVMAARLAVGQLFDYHRSVDRRATTDMAVLFPRRPSRPIVDYLADHPH